MVFKFKVDSFRNLYESEDSRRICVFAAPIANIPAEWEDWRDVNVRDTNVRGDVYNAILDTLRNEPSEMIFRNLGITILAPAIDFDNKMNMVTVTFSDKNKHGIANGGHTFSAIREVLRTANVNAEIKVECIVGELDPDELVDIVDGRNRSRAAQEISLENLAKSYEPIKRALTDPRYRDRIAYSEYEVGLDDRRKDISIREILSYVYCLDGSFNKNTHPIQAYSSKGAVVDFYANKDDRGRDRKDVLARASKILPEILELRDAIYRDLPSAYNELPGKFGALETMGVSKYREPEPLRFTDGTTEYDYPDGFIYPILAGFRKYINHTGDWSWTENPFNIWKQKQHDVASAIKDAVNFSQNANKLGKAAATWRMCYDAL
ncbi:MAG: AIPR family protein [Minisyncoccia bacterium]|jgi:hypothetical protein